MRKINKQKAKKVATRAAVGTATGLYIAGAQHPFERAVKMSAVGVGYGTYYGTKRYRKGKQNGQSKRNHTR